MSAARLLLYCRAGFEKECAQEISAAADQVLLYKLICRQVANQLGMTACFLPNPLTGVNGTGLPTNLPVARARVNLAH